VSLRAQLLAQLSRFDDDAWSALANRGLLRRARKDLAVLSLELVADEADALDIQVGSHVVRFDARGPVGAACDCPSASVCQHIIVAGLWLLSTPDDGQPGTQSAQPQPQAELLGADVVALTTYAGRAGYRWALRYVDDLDLESDVRVEEDQQIVISLTSPRVTFRFMGGGVAGLVPDTKLPALEKYQVAAVLVYQRMAGVGPPAEVRELSKPSGGGQQLVESRTRLRVAAGNLLTDTVRLGIAHLSQSVHERYESLAVWSQGAEYHRLASMLRRLADHVELLLVRSARADEHRLLEEAAIAYALVCALDSGDEQPRLVGHARNRYDVVGRLEVIGLGAFPWRAASGYRGLTTLFWWSAESRFLSWSDARPDVMRGFDPRYRYNAPGPWAGLGSPADATGAALRISDARLSPSGRLSGTERTRATVTLVDGIAGSLPAVTRWAELERRPSRSLLDPPDPLADWVVLRPAGFGRPRFDQVRQLLEWEVTDDEGSSLSLQQLYTLENRHAIDRTEALEERDLPAGTQLVARVRRTVTGLVGEPMSLVRPDLGAGSEVDPLHFGEVAPSKDRVVDSPREVAGHAVYLPRQLEDLRSWLIEQAERGTGAASSGALTASLATRHQSVRDIGFGVFPAVADEDPAIGILRSFYLLLQTIQLLTGESR
jgi:hypothetical protein